MKKKLLLFTAFFAFILYASAQESIVNDVFEQFVTEKVERMQELIGFDDEQAIQLKKVELKFLQDVNAAENSFWCRSKKRIEKLNKKREADLQEILTREQYIKYNAIDNSLIKEQPEIQV